ncbi:MAG TPA: 2-oxoacid:acceptor oxidoreductase subunit alpha [Anaerolineaceae bacterium]|nr:2-oxoacid:acceptor oxidoreductase subunit alpha [Longilinea sp.]HQF45968.1 2-oxoacid:acceptor oxidoreductase subunit alpha [Anaerolineaceae bacterium]HQP59806.1 2-oxoacid:acceptor oxidoreductase subunit alpha [Anaerolineaceae bacterium]
MSEETIVAGNPIEQKRCPIVNDFCMTVSTVNGSGSATANNLLLRSLFRMGIPVSGKNIFPSNIQGLPTWYTIRVSRKGYIGRVAKDDIVVAMNPATIAKEAPFISPGGVMFYADDLRISDLREDIIAYPMPVKKLVKEADVAPSMRDYIANMVYVGVLAQMIGIPLDVVYQTLEFQFKGKKKAIDSNWSVVKAAADWAAANLEKRDPFRVEPMNGTEGYIMADGNMAGALGALYGGLQFAGWYPITPATSLAETFTDYVPLLRTDPETGRQTCAVVQAEDELAAIGMVVGAGWAGLRAMTSTSGPGLSLMAEYLGLAYYAEVPVVVWDVQRVGPSTGLPTRTAQCDYTFAYFISHGDTQYIILIPGSVNECFEFGWRALDIAEHFQTPVLVMSDLDLGMNQWMTPAFQYPDQPMDRGKILWEDDLEKLLAERNGDWGRYLDIDGDGIPYRTVAGNRHPRSAYFTRGTGHDEYGRYNEEGDVWEQGMNRLAKKINGSRELLPKPVLKKRDGAKIGIISAGSTDPAIIEACDLLEADGIPVDYLRLRALPVCQQVLDFIKDHDCVYVVEMNRDGQLQQILSLETPEHATRLKKVAHMDGFPLTAQWISSEIKAQEAK